MSRRRRRRSSNGQASDPGTALTAPQRSLLAAGEAAVAEIERARSRSRQPRFSRNGDRVFSSVLRWLKRAEITEPKYQSDSRIRDEWLSEFWLREPLLAGVLASVVMIDANRGWEMVGGRNQVRRYTQVLHDADEGAGWRSFAAKAALAMRVTDLGFVTELGFDGRAGPLRQLWSVDPTTCRLTGNVDKPLEYIPKVTHPRDAQQWPTGTFLRGTSLPNFREEFHGLGFCAESRALELAKIAYAVYQHDQEQLGARAPRGLLLLQNISMAQWDDAMEVRDAALDAKGRTFFDLVAVLASEGVDQIDAKLVALSQLPKDFSHREFTDMLMFSYALTFGYDAREFWPVSGGALGTATETEAQRRSATVKGALEFATTFQEQLQQHLPESLAFQFEHRDVQGEQLDAELLVAKAELAVKLFTAETKAGDLLLAADVALARERALTLLADNQVIPDDWTLAVEEVTATDEESVRLRRERERLLEQPAVRAAARLYPDEPIVRYRWPLDREVELWPSGADALRRRSQPVQRQAISGVEAEFAADLDELIQGYLDRELKLSQVRARLADLIDDAFTEAAELGWQAGGADLVDLDDGLVLDVVATQQEFALGFTRDLPEYRRDDVTPDLRAGLYVRSLRGTYNEFKLRAAPKQRLRWRLGSTKEHCTDCRRLDGEEHPASYYLERGLFPGRPGSATECGGFECQCTLRDRRGRRFTL